MRSSHGKKSSFLSTLTAFITGEEDQKITITAEELKIISDAKVTCESIAKTIAQEIAEGALNDSPLLDLHKRANKLLTHIINVEDKHNDSALKALSQLLDGAASPLTKLEKEFTGRVTVRVLLDVDPAARERTDSLEDDKVVQPPTLSHTTSDASPPPFLPRASSEAPPPPSTSPKSDDKEDDAPPPPSLS